MQLDYTVASKYLYTERYGYKSGINKTMQNELREITVECLKRVKQIGKITAVEIGVNDGTLLKQYPKSVLRIGEEPITKLAK